jgi:signal transduction histidine kinase
MRARLFAVLVVLFAVLLLTLGVPLGRSFAAAQARTVYIDRLADLARFAELLPASPQDVDKRALLAELRRYEDLYSIPVAALGADGSVTVTSRPGVPGDDPQTAAVVRAALAGRAGAPPEQVLPWQREPLVVAQPVMVDGDVVGAVVSVSELDRARGRVLRLWLLLTTVGVVALAVGLVVAQGIARWVLRPVAVLDGAAYRIAVGELEVRVPAAHGPPELRRLGDAFNAMAGSVQAAVQAQRAFVADASHQLRNPLGALLVRLEGLTLNVAGDQRAAVEHAADDGRHLAETLDRMLELARAEHLGAAARSVDVAELVDQRLASWRVVAERRDVRVLRTGAATATAWHERAAVVGALDAVLDNAVKYSPSGGTVSVDVSVSAPLEVRTEVPAGVSTEASEGVSTEASEGVSTEAFTVGGTVEVRVVDEGPGLDGEELQRATDRFWRGRRHRDVGGSGLGLSIASALLARFGGRLRVAAGPQRGLQVLLQMPGPAAGGTVAGGTAPVAGGEATGQGLAAR